MSEFQPRRATAGAVYGYTDRDGKQQQIKADDDGVVTPTSVEEEAVLDGFELPVARKVEAEQKAEQKADKKETN